MQYLYYKVDVILLYPTDNYVVPHRKSASAGKNVIDVSLPLWIRCLETVGSNCTKKREQDALLFHFSALARACARI